MGGGLNRFLNNVKKNSLFLQDGFPKWKDLQGDDGKESQVEWRQMCRNNDRDKKTKRGNKDSAENKSNYVENLRWNKLSRKNGWESKYQQEASQNLSPKQLQQKRGK